jgi:tetratricopeptide (TPR) repeat protein
MKRVRVLVLLFLIAFSAGAQSLKEAIKYSDREQFQKAKSILSVLISTDSKNVDEYYYYLGDICFKNDQLDSARYWFMQGVKLNESSALNYVGLGKVSMDNNPVEGKANFDKAVSIAKKDARVYAAIAEYYTTLDKPKGKEALEYAKKGVEADPKNSWAKLMLGDAQLKGLGEAGPSKAILQYKEAFALDPNSPLALWKIGNLYLAARNYELGIQTFKDGLTKDSLFAPIYKDLGELYYRANKYDKAISSYKKYLEIRDKSDMTDFRYASFLFINGDYTNALIILDALNKKNFNNPILYRIMAYSQYETKDYKTALQTMDLFWKKAEDRKVISQDYEYYGKILAKNGKDSLAVEYINKALEKDTSRKELYSEIVTIWYGAKKYDKSAAALQKKIDITKATARPTALANDYLTLGRTYMIAKNYAMADSAFANVVLLKPELAIGYINRARANGNLDPNQEKGLAKPFYEKFIEMAKADPEKNKNELIEANSYLGAYYYKKDKAKYDEAWGNVRALDPTNKQGIAAEKLKW